MRKMLFTTNKVVSNRSADQVNESRVRTMCEDLDVGSLETAHPLVNNTQATGLGTKHLHSGKKVAVQ